RVLVRRLDLNTFGHGEVDVVAVAQLQAQVLTLGLGAIPDAADLQDFGEALGHPGDEVLYQRALHAPRGAITLRVNKRSHADFAFGDLIFHEIVEQLHRELALGTLYGKRAALDGRSHASRH